MRSFINLHKKRFRGTFSTNTQSLCTRKEVVEISGMLSSNKKGVKTS